LARQTADALASDIPVFAKFALPNAAGLTLSCKSLKQQSSFIDKPKRHAAIIWPSMSTLFSLTPQRSIKRLYFEKRRFMKRSKIDRMMPGKVASRMQAMPGKKYMRL